MPSLVAIPTPLTPLVGRAEEVASVAELLRTSRLVTTVGPGGVGKTRLAVAVAQAAIADFPDGVVFVDLSVLRDPALVVPTIAATLGVREAGDEPILTTLGRAVGSQQLLLLLDNVEQVIEAAREVSSILRTCPNLHVLATSRVPLHVSGEREFVVQPLSVGRGTGGPMDGTEGDSPAIRLFVDRAQSVRSDFQPTVENIAAIAAICARLDGLPLAIELAAARTKVLTPMALLAQLEHPLAALTGGARDLPDRQRTMADAVRWSYDLLTPDEQRLFRRLSVFVGGWTMPSAETVVCAADDLRIDVLDGMSVLVDASLVTQHEQSDDEVRFSMLGTIREFAELELLAAGEHVAAYADHAVLMAQMAEGADAAIRGPQQRHVLRLLHAEQANLRAAMGHSLRDGLVEGVVGARVAVALVWFWFIQGRFREGHDWLALVLEAEGLTSGLLHAKASIGKGMFRWRLGEVEAAVEPVSEGTRTAEALGDTWYGAFGLHQLAHLRDETGDLTLAMRLFGESIDAFVVAGDPWGVALGHSCFGRTLYARGDFEAARLMLLQAVVEFEQVGDEWYLSTTWQRLADVTLAEGRFDESAGWYRASLLQFIEQGDELSVADTLVRLAQIAVETGHYERAAQLYGAAERMHESHQMALYGRLRPDYDAAVARARAALGDDRMLRQWAIGRQMSLDQATTLALHDDQHHEI
ncbi:MAG TPA: tetratricopeptide repeat protein [Thermomicrobiales bacterium]|nr:tetratricopeptide repeat protein [Thermomicrobiales bacterium]